MMSVTLSRVLAGWFTLIAFIFAAPVLSAVDCSVSTTGGSASTNHFEHQFDSGAHWELCWRIDVNAGLTLENVYYTAPSEEQRMVLKSASLGQILFKYDEDIEASHLLVTPGLGGSQSRPAGNSHCGNASLVASPDGASICHRTRYLNSLTQVRNKSSLKRHETSLHAWSQIGSHSYEVIWSLTEDGEINPQVLFSGRLSRYTTNLAYGTAIDDSGRVASSATFLVNWRLDFDIAGTPANDRVEEIDFPAHVTDAVRRSISYRELSVETMRVVDRENFRGWRIFDSDMSSAPQGSSRIGYYLDPQESGQNYTSHRHNWTRFDFFVTQRNDCEWLASNNDIVHPDCASSLDYFSDGQFLDPNNSENDMVLWYSIARHFAPSAEDYPAINTRSIGFKVIPFDWSAYTPFSEPPEQ